MTKTSAERSRARIAVYGGSFDPVHAGHIAVAARVQEEFDLDRVVFLPAGLPPHKRGRRLAAPEHRLRMLEIAIAEHPDFVVDDRELKRSGPSYSYDSMSEIRAEVGDAELFFLIGWDSLELLPRWHRIEELARLCRFIVVARPGFPLALVDQARALQPALRLEILETELSALSSTEIRGRLARGEDLSDLMSEALLAYIDEQGLYREAPEAQD